MKEFARAFYHSTEWERFREFIKRRDKGLCQRCERHGRVTPGAIVHHKEPLTPDNIDDPSVTLNPEKCELVCKVCHEEIHGELEYGALNGRKPVKPRVAFDAHGNVVMLPDAR